MGRKPHYATLARKAAALSGAKLHAGYREALEACLTRLPYPVLEKFAEAGYMFESLPRTVEGLPDHLRPIGFAFALLEFFPTDSGSGGKDQLLQWGFSRKELREWDWEFRKVGPKMRANVQRGRPRPWRY